VRATRRQGFVTGAHYIEDFPGLDTARDFGPDSLAYAVDTLVTHTPEDIAGFLRDVGRCPPSFKIDYVSPISPLFKAELKAKNRPVSDNVPNNRQAQAAAHRRQQILIAVSEGMTVKDAVRRAGVSYQTYTTYRKNDPEWAAEVTVAARTSRRMHDGDAPPLSDFGAARKYYFGYETYMHHQAIVSVLEEAEPGTVTMILLPPEAGKTTTLTDWCQIKIAQNPDYRILYVSEQGGIEGVATKVGGDLRSRLTDPDYEDPHVPEGNRIRYGEFQARYGPFHTEDDDYPWNQKVFKVSKAKGGKDYTFQAAGWESKIYGTRADMLIFDDVQSTRSITKTEKMVATIRGTFFNRVGTRDGNQGSIIFIGTRVGDGDVYETLIRENVVDRLVRIPAINKEGRSFCPEMWSVENLIGTPEVHAKNLSQGKPQWGGVRKKVGEDAWWTNYMQEPRAATSATFPSSVLQNCQTPALTVGQVPGERTDWIISSGLDPALGGWNAQVVAAYNAETLSLMDLRLENGLASNEDIYRIAVDLASAHRYSELVLEINAVQKGIARDDRFQKLARTFGFRIIEHTTNRNKLDNIFGVAAMAADFMEGSIVIPAGDADSVRRFQPLIDQLISWRPGADPRIVKMDAVMALWFVWIRWRQEREVMAQNDDAWSFGGTPWSPGDMTDQWSRSWTRAS
jgi:hypothetical protein